MTSLWSSVNIILILNRYSHFIRFLVVLHLLSRAVFRE